MKKRPTQEHGSRAISGPPPTFSLRDTRGRMVSQIKASLTPDEYRRIVEAIPVVTGRTGTKCNLPETIAYLAMLGLDALAAGDEAMRNEIRAHAARSVHPKSSTV